MLAHIQLCVHREPQGLLWKSAFQLGGPQHVLVQDFALLLVKLHEVPVSPFVQHVEVPMDGSMTLCVHQPLILVLCPANLLRVHTVLHHPDH